MKKSNLVSETTMYSINPGNGAVITHHLPWPRTSPQLERYVAKGFTFERPTVEESFAIRGNIKESTNESPPKVETLKPISRGFYYCGKCKANHRETSKVGKRHLKYKEG